HELRFSSSHRYVGRPQRCPAYVPSAHSPLYPTWRPFYGRNPNPVISRIVDPSTIVIARPTPWLVAHPIPAAIRPFPVTRAIRPPVGRNPHRVPAPSIAADVYPSAIGSQGRVEIRRTLDVNRRRNFQMSERHVAPKANASQYSSCQKFANRFHSSS